MQLIVYQSVLTKCNDITRQRLIKDCSFGSNQNFKRVNTEKSAIVTQILCINTGLDCNEW